MNVDNSEYTGANKIDEVSDDLMYLGFADNGAPADDEKNWAIKRVKKVGTVTSIEWADGFVDKKYKWSERATLSYSLRK